MSENAKPRKTAGKVADKVPSKAPGKAAAMSQKQLEFKLEEWPEKVRAIPNVFLRSSLFSISQTRAMSRKLTEITSLEGVEIRFKGEHFNQDDLDVWEALVHRARKQPLGTHVRFTVNDILHELGLDTGGSQHTQFHEKLTRLQGGVIEIRWPDEGKKLTDKLVGKSFYDEASETYVLMLSEDLLKIYKTGNTWIDSEACKLFRRNALARWLYRFYATHAEPFDIKVETLRNLCGSSQTQRLTDFRKALRIALKLLVDKEVFLTAEICPRRDVVKVTKVPSSSQRRHLEKKRTQAEALQVNQNATLFDSPGTE